MSEKFDVIFYDEDRKTVLDKQEVEKGASVTYQGEKPTKAPENGIEYTFVGWEMTGNITMVMENIECFAKYEAGMNTNSKEENLLFDLSEKNAENAKLDEVMQAGQKVSEAEKATRHMTMQQKQDLVSEIVDKGSVDLGKEAETERD